MRFIGVDTGGTFTDFVYYDGEQLRFHKVLSTPAAPEQAILAGLRALAIDTTELQLVHGSTVATNALLEGKGAVTAYITNKGMADVLTIGRQSREDIYCLTPVARSAPISEELCFEVDARVAAGGEIVTDLQTADIASLKQKLSQHNIAAVAINLLFSFVNPEHEKLIARALPKHLFVSCSHEVLPEYGEYERGIVTWINASLGPIMHDYLARLTVKLPKSRITVMQSSAGTVAAREAKTLAVHLLLSGPAGGLIGARACAEQANINRLLSFDMGGTSTDVALIDGDIQLTRNSRIGRYPIAVPMVDMHTIGAGGGSIARVDAGGLLQVGPESAGAKPGPACYGLGGVEATVTDANLVLGRIPAASVLAGAMTLQLDAAEQALDELAVKLQISREQAAAGVIRLANEHMLQALRVISVQRGIDISEFTLFSFGGAGGLHVCALAELMGMSRAMIPLQSGVFSALGMLMAPRQRVLTRTLAKPLAQFSASDVLEMLREMSASGSQKMSTEGVDPQSMHTQYSLDLRYTGQSYTLEVPWQDSTSKAEEAFHQRHNQCYGHELPLAVELVNLRLKLQRPAAKIVLPRPPQSDNPPAREYVKVYGYGDVVPCLQRNALQVGTRLQGPHIIVEPIATTFVDTGWHSIMDKFGNILLRRS